MDEIKPWYASRTIWGAALAVVSGVVPVAGSVLNLPGVHDGAVDLLSGLGASIGGAIAAYGRINADARLK